MGGGTTWPEYAVPNDRKLCLGQQLEPNTSPLRPMFGFTTMDNEKVTELRLGESTIEDFCPVTGSTEDPRGDRGEDQTFANGSGYCNAEDDDMAFRPGPSDTDDDGKLSVTLSFATKNDTSSPIDLLDITPRADTIDQIAEHWLSNPTIKQSLDSDADWWNVASYPETCRSYAQGQSVSATTSHDDELKIKFEAAVVELKAIFSEAEQAAREFAETLEGMKRLICESSEA